LVVIGIAIAGIGRQAGSQEHFDIGASHITRPPRSLFLLFSAWKRMQNTKLEFVYLPLRLNFRVNCTSAEEWPEQLFRVYFEHYIVLSMRFRHHLQLIVESTQAYLSQLLSKQK
jgi:hypothetical protein